MEVILCIAISCGGAAGAGKESGCFVMEMLLAWILHTYLLMDKHIQHTILRCSGIHSTCERPNSN